VDTGGPAESQTQFNSHLPQAKLRQKELRERGRCGLHFDSTQSLFTLFLFKFGSRKEVEMDN
jgi:hypothetical protein